MTPFVVACLVLGFALVGWVLFGRERFQNVDYYDQNKTQVARTLVKEDSSYEQSTNHMPRPPAVSPPLQGVESPFQVNQFRAYIT
uniref:Uncharacterized protein n=1 Tax=viral metagenome TaxID=1070528 RepID=A0A6C0J5L6_9ZZZZ